MSERAQIASVTPTAPPTNLAETAEDSIAAARGHLLQAVALRPSGQRVPGFTIDNRVSLERVATLLDGPLPSAAAIARFETSLRRLGAKLPAPAAVHVVAAPNLPGRTTPTHTGRCQDSPRLPHQALPRRD